MMRRPTSLLLVLITLCVFQNPLLGAKEDYELDEFDSSKSVFPYGFHEHLESAQVVYFSKGKDPVEGTWSSNGFSFLGARAARVQLAPFTFLGEKYEAIKITPPTDGMIQLRFQDVPAGTKINMTNIVMRDKGASQGNAYFYVQVYVGKQFIRRFRIGAGEDAKREVMDLGVVGFLKKNLTVTYKISSDSPSGVQLFISSKVTR